MNKSFKISPEEKAFKTKIHNSEQKRFDKHTSQNLARYALNEYEEEFSEEDSDLSFQYDPYSEDEQDYEY